MHGPKQTAILAYTLLIKRLAIDAYIPTPLANGFFKHKTRRTPFILCTLREMSLYLYLITFSMLQGNIITLLWHNPNMHGTNWPNWHNIVKTSKKCVVVLLQDSSTKIYSLPCPIFPYIKHHQQSILSKKAQMLLDYLGTYPKTKFRFYSRNMQLCIGPDAAYFVLFGTKSRIAWYLYLNTHPYPTKAYAKRYNEPLQINQSNSRDMKYNCLRDSSTQKIFLIK